MVKLECLRVERKYECLILYLTVQNNHLPMSGLPADEKGHGLCLHRILPWYHEYTLSIICHY